MYGRQISFDISASVCISAKSLDFFFRKGGGEAMLVSYAASQLILKHSEREYANNIERQSLDHMNSITIEITKL